ncbi:MAG TPA: CPBP family intramembrane glutamic endopeptidase, partial [Propionibacteriaceae bacterium]|nr:CPBP family intramembrane glutamic endopeptidase [Propionibacteriaceae bacterium]
TVVGALTWQFEPDAAINLAINIVIISFFAFFEEIGWRGYMLPKMATAYPRMAPALVGFLHGVWHLPLMLLTTAYNPAGNRLIVVPLFLAVLTVAGILYGYLRNESGSLWPVVIAHGTFNAVLGTLAGSSVAANQNTAAYLTGETGVFTLLALIVLTWVLMMRPAIQKEDHLAVHK